MTDRILVVDDHPLTREALQGLLNHGGFDVVGVAGSGEDAIHQARELQPDIVLLDLSLPGLSGFEALPLIQEAATAAEIVVLTASEDDQSLLQAIKAGASGYLLKSEPPERILNFLRGVARGEAALSGVAARRLLDQVREGTRGEVPAEIANTLSARELQVLLLLDHHLSTEEIASRLFISEHTVRSHVKNLLAKLGVSSRREALEKLDVARG
jgi:DNA-binding NarL/FixJ family response regulator